MMGVLVNPSSNSLPIIHPFNDRESFGIMTGIGLLSDSIHSICSAFSPLELIFFLIPHFSSFSLFILYVFSHPFIVTWILRGMKKSLNLSLTFPIKNLSKLSGSKHSGLFLIGDFGENEETLRKF